MSHVRFANIEYSLGHQVDLTTEVLEDGIKGRAKALHDDTLGLWGRHLALKLHFHIINPKFVFLN